MQQYFAVFQIKCSFFQNKVLKIVDANFRDMQHAHEGESLRG